MPYDLSPEECRVLGALIEKDLSTPEYYPLSLNALVNACNQKSNRDPVVSYDDPTAFAALDSLRHRGLAAFVHEAGSRVEKYRHRISEQWNLTRGELAILTALLLRGPQTGGELRQNTARLHPFEDLDVVAGTLQRLAERDPDPLAMQLPLLPGTKEPRWAHLLSGEPPLDRHASLAPTPTARPDAETQSRLSALEEQVSTLREDIHELRQMLDHLRRSLGE